MWYKRYGYRTVSGDAGDIGCVAFLFIPLLSIGLAVALVYLFRLAWLGWLFIPFALVGFYFSSKYAAGEGRRRRTKRQALHIKKAHRYIEAGKTARALESIRRAKIYGKIPKELKEFEKHN
ncbi:hypothetical protein QSV34_14660 [Porticoccus sp. W117]|uniref:hypothetical protein n=1 Tax=Porticoccus sp. W117 TaxID=3054777 RepID=UPI0025994EF4|nr:hypothetical protein [Porticoccus sp. W117]MDM3872592.1 hypothetical protein [Porticoccus sp. W117]